MSIINKSALVTYDNAQMFALVDDIAAYHSFLPWCKNSTVLDRQPQVVEARLEIAYGSLQKSFTTRNLNTAHDAITMELLDGPFKFLRGKWLFVPLGTDGSKISLNLEFEFSSKLLDLTVGPVFNQIANSMVDAFTQRARQVYG